MWARACLEREMERGADTGISVLLSDSRTEI